MSPLDRLFLRWLFEDLQRAVEAVDASECLLQRQVAVSTRQLSVDPLRGPLYGRATNHPAG